MMIEVTSDMSQERECVRCVVTLALKELSWEEPPGSPLHLTGPPVFVRACVLGQLQYTSLFQPNFPLQLQRNLNFDRVLTNCSDPSLLKEVVTGEHVYIEMIQVSEDCEGGTILARYEAPADEFLFPDGPLGSLRTLALSKSRKYKHSPHVTLTTSTSVTKVTIHTPSPSPPTKPPSHTKKPTLSKTKSRKKVGGTTQDKLRLLLDSYTEPHPQDSGREEGGHNAKIGLQPPVRKTTSKAEESRSSTGGRNFKVQRPLTPNPADLYHCCTAFVGPHNWTSCPRRSFRRHRVPSRGQKSSHLRSKSAPRQHLRKLGGLEEPLTEKQYCGPQQGSGRSRRPFVAGRVDPQLLSKRDFCGQVPGKKAERHESSDGRRSARGRRGGVLWRGEFGEGWGRRRGVGEMADGTATLRRLTQFEEEYVGRKDGADLNQQQMMPRSEAVRSTTTVGTNGTSGIHGDDDETPPPEAVCSAPPIGTSGIHGDNDETSSSTGTSLTSSTPDSCDASGRDVEEGDVLSEEDSEVETCGVKLRHHLLSKYLQYQHGNGRMGMGSPARQIETKLNALIQECCECRHSAESLGQDDMTEDNERLSLRRSSVPNETK